VPVRWYRGWLYHAIALLLGTPGICQAQSLAQQHDVLSIDSTLLAKLVPLVDSFRGHVGVYVHPLSSNRTVQINADEIFSTASMIKVPILIGAFAAMERGDLEFEEELVYTDSLLYPGEDILGSYAEGAKIPLAQVPTLMITTSDNTAALWPQHLAVQEFGSTCGWSNTASSIHESTPELRGDTVIGRITDGDKPRLARWQSSW
jgi:hypothetical protein